MSLIQEIVIDDRDDLVRFCMDFDQGKYTEKFWTDRMNSWWDKNPYFSESDCRGFKILNNDTIQGFIGLVPQEMMVAGEVRKVFSLTTWRVLEEARSQSMMAFLKCLQVTKDTLLFNTTPNDVVQAILPKFQFELSPQAVDETKNQMLLLPVRPHRLVALVRDGKLAGFALPLLPFSAVLNLFYRLYLRFRLKGSTNSFLIRKLTGDEPEIDELWDQSKDIYATTNIRDKCFYSWAYHDNYTHPLELVGCYDQGNLAALFLVDYEHNQKFNYATVVDIWHGSMENRSLLNSLTCLLYYLTKSEADAVKILDFRPEVRKHLRKLGCFQLERSDRTDYLRCANKQLLENIKNQSCYFSVVQGDRFI